MIIGSNFYFTDIINIKDMIFLTDEERYSINYGQCICTIGNYVPCDHA